MIIAIPKEILDNETRVSCPPGSVKELIKNGYEVYFETGCGLASSISDEDYKSVGAKLVKDSSTLYQKSDIILRVNSPSFDEIKLLKRDSTIISFFQTTRNLKEVQALKDKEITGFSMHLVKINQSHFCKTIKWQKHFSDTINRIGQPAFFYCSI